MHSSVCLSAFVLLASTSIAGETHLTIYTSDLAVVRESVPIDLKPGENQVRYADMTAHAETDSVILRDPSGRSKFSILEQDYRADQLSPELLLQAFEGQTIPFLITYYGSDKREIVPGKILRAPYVRHSRGLSRYGPQYYASQTAYAGDGGGVPIVEMEGSIRFGLPGQPLFPSLGDGTILKPTMDWTIAADTASKFDAELAYVTGGMGWQADYVIVAAEKGALADITAWVTIDNQSGKTFENARVKLMAGDVNKIKPEERDRQPNRELVSALAVMAAPSSSVKAFDDLHLYTLARPTTVRDRETKQVEFKRGEGVTAARVYVYDGARIDVDQYGGWNYESIRGEPQFGTQTNSKVWVIREIENSEKNHLGIPLPKGRVRFYRRDTDDRLEFVGESLIDHTPQDETLRIYTGNAFDVVGDRQRSNYHTQPAARWLEESFEIVLRNHKEEPVEVRVVEHLYRATNWEIKDASGEWKKKDAQTIEFRVALKAQDSQSVKYTAHYSW